MVAADGGGLPPSVISRGIGGIELELAILVIAGKEECGTKRPRSSYLRVLLLDVANIDNNLLDGNRRSKLETVVLNE